MSEISRWDNLKLNCYFKDELVAKVSITGVNVAIKRLSTHPVKQIFYADNMHLNRFIEVLRTRLWQEKRA